MRKNTLGSRHGKTYLVRLGNSMENLVLTADIWTLFLLLLCFLFKTHKFLLPVHCLLESLSTTWPRSSGNRSARPWSWSSCIVLPLQVGSCVSSLLGLHVGQAFFQNPAKTLLLLISLPFTCVPPTLEKWPEISDSLFPILFQTTEQSHLPFRTYFPHRPCHKI